MKILVVTIAVAVLLLPFSAKAAQGGWKTWPAGPAIVSMTSVINGRATITFAKPEYAGRKVKAGVMLRYLVNKSKDHPKGVKWDSQNAVMVLDKNGRGTIELKNLSDRKTYHFLLSLKQLEPHVESTQPSKYTKLKAKP